MERASLSVEWLRDARLDRGWSQEYVAEKVNVDKTTVQRWERGKNQPQPCKYRQLELLFERAPKPQTEENRGTVEAQAPQRTRSTPAPEGEQAQRQAGARPMVIDTYTRFVAFDLGIRLDRVMRTWSICNGNARYHELQTLLSREIEPRDNTMQENLINRRNALRRLASVPIELWGLTLFAPAVLKPFPFDDLLHQCAAGITALWYLRRGKDLAFAHDAVSRYIPTLEEMVATSTGQQHKDAADLLAQSLLLKGVVVRHIQANHTVALHYQQQAEIVSEQAGNKALTIAAMRAQAASHDYADNWKQAMHMAEKAKHLIETAEEETPIPLMLQSFVHIGLANYQAHIGQKYKQDALTSLGLARTTFDAAIANKEMPPPWIDHTEGNVLLNGGLAYYHLGMSQQAIDSFAKISQLQDIHETNLTESFIDQVMAEVNREDQSPDMAFCIARWKQGIQRAIALRSEQSYNEAKIAYAAMRGAWRTEPRIKALAEYVKHW